MKARQKVLEVLENNTELSNMLISSSWHDEKAGYPQITITQLSNTQWNNHDNKVDGRIALIQIDIWSKGNPFVVAEKVQNLMSENKYYYTDEKELNETDVNRVMVLYKILEF